jgi:hypothetical protein
VELAGGDPFGGARVCLGDVVLQVVGPDAPHAPAADLDSAELPRPEQGPNLVRAYVQLISRLLNRQEPVLFGFVGGNGPIL